jgi:hypothetical protein
VCLNTAYYKFHHLVNKLLTAEPEHKPFIPFRTETPIRVRNSNNIFHRTFVMQVSRNVWLSVQNVLFVTYCIRATCPVNLTFTRSHIIYYMESKKTQLLFR